MIQAKDTVGEAIFLKEYLIQENEIDEINIITSDWHEKRAKEIFKFIFGAHNDPRLLFHIVSGKQQESDLEKDNNSLNKFRELIQDCERETFIQFINQ